AGYFGPRERIWEQPIDRNVFGVLTEFGDAELARMVGARRLLVIDPSPGPKVEIPAGQAGAPAKLVGPTSEQAAQELARVAAFADGIQMKGKEGVIDFVTDLSKDGNLEIVRAPHLKEIKYDPEPRHARLIHQ